jgi:hypothetical protein
MLVVKGSSEMWKGSIPELCGHTEWMQEEILQKNIMVTARKQLKEICTGVRVCDTKFIVDRNFSCGMWRLGEEAAVGTEDSKNMRG